MSLPSWALILIQFAWTGLQAILTQVGVPSIVIQAIAAVLQHFGLLSASGLSEQELRNRAQALHDHIKSLG